MLELEYVHVHITMRNKHKVIWIRPKPTGSGLNWRWREDDQPYTSISILFLFGEVPQNIFIAVQNVSHWHWGSPQEMFNIYLCNNCNCEEVHVDVVKMDYTYNPTNSNPTSTFLLSEVSTLNLNIYIISTTYDNYNYTQIICIKEVWHILSQDWDRDV